MTTYAHQLRSAGMGGILGFDVPALLDVAGTLGYSRRLMAQLIPFAEAGLLEAVQERQREETV